MRYCSYPQIYEFTILRSGVDITTAQQPVLAVSGRYGDITGAVLQPTIDKDLNSLYQISTYGVVNPWYRLTYTEKIEFDEIKVKMISGSQSSPLGPQIQLSQDGLSFVTVKQYSLVSLNDGVYKVILP